MNRLLALCVCSDMAEVGVGESEGEDGLLMYAFWERVIQ